jgi:hypothetical protein
VTDLTRQILESHPHTKRDGSWWEHDARGIELCRVCEQCKEAKLARYRPEVLTDPGYEANEPIDPE